MFIRLVILVVFVVSHELNATPTYSLESDEGPEQSLDDMDDISGYIFHQYGNKDTKINSGRDEKRTPALGLDVEVTLPQKRSYIHPWSSSSFPFGKRAQIADSDMDRYGLLPWVPNEIEERFPISADRNNNFKRTPENYGFDHLARMKKGNYGFDHLARMKKANYGFNHLARMKKSNYGFDHLARMKKENYGFNHLTRMKKPSDGSYDFDHLTRI